MPCHGSKHKKGTGGAGGSPVKFVKREGSLEKCNPKKIRTGKCK